MKVLMVSPEAVPYAKTGGLADVAGALVSELVKKKVDTLLVMPFYSTVARHFNPEDTGKSVKIKIGDKTHEGRILRDKHAVFLKCSELYDRAELYGTPEGDYPDNARRFVFLSRGALEAAKALDFKPNIVHCHDWQAALIPLYLKSLYSKDPFFAGAKSVMTIHNLGYQGVFPADLYSITGLGPELFTPEGVEFYGNVNFLKAGLISADMITTVSPNYAREILLPENGFGLDGVLKSRSGSLRGILNGIDETEWDPAKDKSLPSNYYAVDLAGKAACRKKLISECGLKEGRGGLVASFVGRLSGQKGVDVIIEAAPEILSMGVNLVFLGKGDVAYQKALQEFGRSHAGRVFANIGFDEGFSRLVYAGSDIFLMPSRYEPCGLGQMIALRYGTPPVACRTGGLADTITDYDPYSGKGNGFLFDGASASGLLQAVKLAVCAFSVPKRRESIIKAGMRAGFTWKKAVLGYTGIYKELSG